MKNKLEKFIEYIIEHSEITIVAIAVIYFVVMFYFLISHLG